MGVYLSQTVILCLLIISFCVKAHEKGICTYEEGLFEGEQPKPAYLVDLKSKDINMFYVETCCSAEQMHSVSLAGENLATHGEASKDCLDLFELLKCSICGPNTRSFPISASFCDSVFEACSDAYFTSNAMMQVIVPCGGRECIICLKASKWWFNGTTFCDALGYTVQAADESVEDPSYQSKSELEPVIGIIKAKNVALSQNHQIILYVVTVAQPIVWLLLGIFFNRWRNELLRLEMIERDVEEHEREWLETTLNSFLVLK